AEAPEFHRRAHHVVPRTRARRRNSATRRPETEADTEESTPEQRPRAAVTQKSSNAGRKSRTARRSARPTDKPATAHAQRPQLATATPCNALVTGHRPHRTRPDQPWCTAPTG